MEYKTENSYEKRVARVEAAVSLTEGDRVPFAPKIGLAYVDGANCNRYEAMQDFRNIKPGVVKFLSRYETDLFWVPSAYSIPMLETLGTSSVRWPGPTCGIDRNRGFQVCDATYMEEDEYDELIADPTRFFMTKLWPRKFKKLSGLSKLSFDSIMLEFGCYAGMSVYTDQEVRDALLTLMAAGNEALRWQAGIKEVLDIAVEMQTPIGAAGGITSPYDLLADLVRGFLNVPMDVIEIPEKVKAAVDVMTDISFRALEDMATKGKKYCFMPLHSGTDEFMSEANYLEFYLPPLMKVINKALELGLIPYIFFEGKYNRRLEILKEAMPKKKIIAMFEQVDIFRAKKLLGDSFCICGNLPGSDLIYSEPKKIIEETKRMLDVCAPGGGFIMDSSLVIDSYNEANMDAWYQTTIDYGKY